MCSSPVRYFRPRVSTSHAKAPVPGRSDYDITCSARFLGQERRITLRSSTYGLRRMVWS